MKKMFMQYAEYNVWASQRLFDCILKLSEEQLHQNIVSSFNGIHQTMLHLWDAESIWWQRIKLKEQPDIPSVVFSGTSAELAKHIIQQSLQWKDWVHAATEAALAHEFIYRNSKREQFKQPVSEVLLHLFNHQSYHRGQLITMLRQLGVQEVPSTDFVLFLRKK